MPARGRAERVHFLPLAVFAAILYSQCDQAEVDLRAKALTAAAAPAHGKREIKSVHQGSNDDFHLTFNLSSTKNLSAYTYCTVHEAQKVIIAEFCTERLRSEKKMKNITFPSFFASFHGIFSHLEF